MPYWITDIDVTELVPALTVPPDHDGIAMVVRREQRPIGFVMRPLPAGSHLNEQQAWEILYESIDAELLEGTGAGSEGSNEESKEMNWTTTPSLTVAICTKDHPDDLKKCLQRLHAVCEEDGGTEEILVVDNAPSDDATKRLVDSWPGVGYVHEPKPGLNFARNRALHESTTDFLAFVDDDVLVDKHWLTGWRTALAANPDAAAFTGLVLPSELQTRAQILFEAWGGFEKSFQSIRYGPTLPGHPFYPCLGGKFGTGCNMAFRRDALLELGGFDEALDTGAPLPGGGDADMFYRVVRAGYPLVYEPQFLVFHRHRRTYEQLRRQYGRSWGKGMMAFISKSYRYDVDQRQNLRRLVRWWFGYYLSELYASLRGKHVLPPDLLAVQLWGGVVGLAGAYGRSVRRVQRIRQHHR